MTFFKKFLVDTFRDILVHLAKQNGGAYTESFWYNSQINEKKTTKKTKTLWHHVFSRAEVKKIQWKKIIYRTIWKDGAVSENLTLFFYHLALFDQTGSEWNYSTAKHSTTSRLWEKTGLRKLNLLIWSIRYKHINIQRWIIMHINPRSWHNYMLQSITDPLMKFDESWWSSFWDLVWNCVFWYLSLGLHKNNIFIYWMPLIYEPAHNKTYNKTYVTSKDSDQPVNPPSTPRVLVYPS